MLRGDKHHTFRQHHQTRGQRLSVRLVQASYGTAVGGGAIMDKAPPGKQLFSFGVISDVQYADIPDGVSFHGVPRYYRNALVALRRAVGTGWVAAGVQFGIHFGDILDGYQPKDRSEEALTDVLDAFSQLPAPTYHMLGNHCLYNFPRQRLNQRLHIPPAADGGSYYSFSPHPAWLFVVLDAYDVSLLGWPADHPRHLLAEEILAKNNPNMEKNSPEGLVGVARRFVKFNGGVSETQIEWLKQQLQAAESAGQNVIVCSHLPLFPGTCPPACLLWNYDQVLPILQHSGNVVATMAGHTHQNGYLVDDAGIHHLVLPAVLETPPGRDAYGWVEVMQDRLLLKGVDTCMSCCVKLSAAAMQRQLVALDKMAAAAGEQLEGGAAAGAEVASTAGEAAAAAAAAAGGPGRVDLIVELEDEGVGQLKAVGSDRGDAAAGPAAAAVVTTQLAACTLQTR